MAKYKVYVEKTETTVKNYTVEANSLKAAISRAEDMARDEDDNGDFDGEMVSCDFEGFPLKK